MKSAAAAYRTASIENAPPLRLVQLLYEGALRYLEQAEAALSAGEGARFQERCLRAQAVIGELRAALDPRHAPELAENLGALYLFVEKEIGRALAAESAAPIGAVRPVLATLLEGWRGLELGS